MRCRRRRTHVDRHKPLAKEEAMSNAEITRDVLDELLWDDRIDASRLTVTADDGMVVLAGTVDTYHERFDAEDDASRVFGVRGVRNEIDVDTAARKVNDEQLEAAARAGLDANGLVPKGAINVTAEDGRIVMSGNVHHYYELQAAEHVIRHLDGLSDYSSLVTVSRDPAAAVSEGIFDSLTRNAAVDADMINVTDDGGRVTLSGTVRSYAEKQEAKRAALVAPGVVSVEDQILVSP
jgi:osmotically-inducible protein OsmY